jgi:hypothetical protein
MTQGRNKDDHEHVHLTCPEAPKKLNAWRCPAKNEAVYRLPANTRRSPAHAGFYKLDTEKA